MSSPGQKRGTCGHVMAVFDGHLKCARCRDKGVGRQSMCPQERLSNLQGVYSRAESSAFHPTYRDRKNKDKKVSASTTPTLVDPSHVNVLGLVNREKTAKKSEPPAGKKKRTTTHPSQAVRNPNPATNPGPMNSGT